MHISAAVMFLRPGKVRKMQENDLSLVAVRPTTVLALSTFDLWPIIFTRALKREGGYVRC